MNPEIRDYWMHRAQCEYDQGHYEQSIEDLIKGLEVSHEDPQVLYKLGLSYYANENYKVCIKTLK
jgi:tetratricopeptide (TPR) repeat protein